MGAKSKTLSRNELHTLVWQTPILRLAEQFSLSGNGLAKICRRLEIPYFPRGHWAKLAAGKKVTVAPLPKPSAGTPDSVRITPTERPPTPDLPDDVQRAIAAVEQSKDRLHVPERLVRSHPIIAAWLAEHERREQEARREREPWRRKMLQPEPYSAQERCRHRILNTLLRELERRGCTITAKHRQLFVETSGEQVEIVLREKHKQTLRPSTIEEQERQPWHGDSLRKELHPTGFLLFEIKHSLPRPLKNAWLETATKPLEPMLPDIVAGLLAAGAVLAQQRREQEELERRRAEEQSRREEEDRRRRLERNRGRRLVELAAARRDVAAVRDLLDAIRAALPIDDPEVAGQPLSEWMTWAEAWVSSADPLGRGVEEIFRDVAQVTPWTYRD